MSIASELSTLIDNKAAIKTAISAKSPTIPPTDVLSQWPTSIASIPSGGGEEWDGVQWKARFNNKLEDWPTSSQSISFNLGWVKGVIDWGDGSTTSASRFTNYTHIYTIRGVYIITITPSTSSPYDYNNENLFNKTGIEEVWLPKNLLFGNNSANYAFPKYCKVHIPKSGCIGNNTLGLILNAWPDSDTLVLATTALSRPATAMTYNTLLRKLVITSSSFTPGSGSQYYNKMSGLCFIEFTNLDNLTCNNYMFYNLPTLQRIIGINSLTVKGAIQLFMDDADIQVVPTLDMTTNIITSCYRMFRGCSALSYLPSGINTSNCTTVQEMFYNCSALKAAPPNLDLSVCTNVTNMFYGCSAMTTLPETITANPNNALTISFPSTNINIDTLAEFDANENIIGGLVYGLNDNTSAASAWTVSFAAAVKTALEAQHPGGWDKVKAMANAKNWNISPA